MGTSQRLVGAGVVAAALLVAAGRTSPLGPVAAERETLGPAVSAAQERVSVETFGRLVDESPTGVRGGSHRIRPPESRARARRAMMAGDRPSRGRGREPTGSTSCANIT